LRDSTDAAARRRAERVVRSPGRHRRRHRADRPRRPPTPVAARGGDRAPPLGARAAHRDGAGRRRAQAPGGGTTVTARLPLRTTTETALRPATEGEWVAATDDGAPARDETRLIK